MTNDQKEPGEFDLGEPQSSSGEPVVDWQRYLEALAHRWWIVLLTTIVVTAAIGGWTARQPKLYRAETSLIIDVRGVQVLTGVQDVYDVSGRGGSGHFFQTEYEIMRSRQVARSAAERLGMAQEDRFNGLEGISDPQVREKRLRNLDPADLVLGAYSIEPDKGSNVVRVVVVHQDPTHAAGLTNAVADAYLDENLGKRIDTTKSASDWLVVQNEELRRKLRTSEGRLLEFMTENGVLNASLDSQLDEVKQRLAAFNAQLAMEEASQIRDVLNVRALEQVRSDPSLLDTLPEIQSASVVSKLKEKLVELRTEEMSAAARYLPDHPKMKLLAEQRAALKLELGREVEALVKSMERKTASTEASIAGLRGALNEERTREAHLNKLAVEYNQLKRERDTDQKLFDMVSSRIKEAEVTGDQPFNNVRILDRALVPEKPFKPNVQQAIVIALLLGAILGVGIVTGIEASDTTISSQADLEAVARGVPFLGLMPVIPVTNVAPTADRAAQLRQTRARDLFVLENPKSTIAECARFIRTNLLFMSPDRPLRTLAVTSPSPQEGKTTTAVTTAITMAQAGSRTLLIDTDMRKPRLHRVFGLESDRGISSVLLGEDNIDDAIQKSEIAGLDILPCGPLPPNPAELLLSERFRDLLTELQGRYERIIFDTPPIGPVTDPAILGALADGVLLVTKCGKTSRDSLRQALRSLNDANARIFGVILNDVDVAAKRYSGTYYSYYRRYGGYYGEDRHEASTTSSSRET